MKKYELTNETKEFGTRTLYRIRALRDIPERGVAAGDLGGWVESESNLSQVGDSWVSDDAYVSGNAWVYGNAHVYGDAIVSGRACITGNARLPSRDSIFTASYVGTENGTLTVTSGVSGLVVTRGCFTGSVDEFLEKSRTVHDDKTHNEYRMLIDVAKSRILVHAVPDTKD